MPFNTLASPSPCLSLSGCCMYLDKGSGCSQHHSMTIEKGKEKGEWAKRQPEVTHISYTFKLFCCTQVLHKLIKLAFNCTLCDGIFYMCGSTNLPDICVRIMYAIYNLYRRRDHDCWRAQIIDMHTAHKHGVCVRERKGNQYASRNDTRYRIAVSIYSDVWITKVHAFMPIVSLGCWHSINTSHIYIHM